VDAALKHRQELPSDSRRIPRLQKTTEERTPRSRQTSLQLLGECSDDVGTKNKEAISSVVVCLPGRQTDKTDDERGGGGGGRRSPERKRDAHVVTLSRTAAAASNKTRPGRQRGGRGEKVTTTKKERKTKER